AVMLLMPCYDSALDAAGVKLVTVSRQAGVVATYELLDPQTGTVTARMEANYLTDLRTAATSAAATDLLRRDAAGTWGGCGCGRLAAAHFFVLRGVGNFRRFFGCGGWDRKMSGNIGLNTSEF